MQRRILKIRRRWGFTRNRRRRKSMTVTKKTDLKSFMVWMMLKILKAIGYRAHLKANSLIHYRKRLKWKIVMKPFRAWSPQILAARKRCSLLIKNKLMGVSYIRRSISRVASPLWKKAPASGNRSRNWTLSYRVLAPHIQPKPNWRRMAQNLKPLSMGGVSASLQTPATNTAASMLLMILALFY